MTGPDAVRELLQRYARAAHDRDVGALGALFHPEAEITGARGTQTLDQWLETIRGPRAFPTSMHLIGDPLIVMDPDADTATADTYAVVFQMSEPGSGTNDLTLGIRYLDEIVRYQGSWVVRRRQARTVWMR